MYLTSNLSLAENSSSAYLYPFDSWKEVSPALKKNPLPWESAHNPGKQRRPGAAPVFSVDIIS